MGTPALTMEQFVTFLGLGPGGARPSRRETAQQDPRRPSAFAQQGQEGVVASLRARIEEQEREIARLRQELQEASNPVFLRTFVLVVVFSVIFGFFR